MVCLETRQTQEMRIRGRQIRKTNVVKVTDSQKLITLRYQKCLFPNSWHLLVWIKKLKDWTFSSTLYMKLERRRKLNRSGPVRKSSGSGSSTVGQEKLGGCDPSTMIAETETCLSHFLNPMGKSLIGPLSKSELLKVLRFEPATTDC